MTRSALCRWHALCPGWWADRRRARPPGTGAIGRGGVDRGGRHRPRGGGSVSGGSDVGQPMTPRAGRGRPAGAGVEGGRWGELPADARPARRAAAVARHRAGRVRMDQPVLDAAAHRRGGPRALRRGLHPARAGPAAASDRLERAGTRPTGHRARRGPDRRLAGGDLAGDKKIAADLGAWLVFEDESGQGLRPPKGRTWGRRGRTPVVRVTAAISPRLSVAALVATRPGSRPRLVYRTHRGRRGGGRKGFTEADYAALLDAAHRQLGGPIVLVWDKCAVWRFAASPTHSGGIWRNIPGSPDSPGGESRRGQQHVRKAVVAPKAFRATRREARAIWPRLDCLKPNLQGCKDPPVGMTPVTDAALCSAMVVPAGQPPQRRTPPNEGGQEDEWAAYVALDTCSEDVPRDHLPGASPTVTECP